jgi:flagellar biosynthesis/type III secretory pathway chaperone
MPDSHDDDTRRLCASLADVLQRECDLYRALHDVLVEEGRALAGASAEALLATLARKESLCEEAERLEANRTELMERLASALGRNPRDLTLTTLQSLVEELPADVLAGVQRELAPLVAEIRTLNERNRAVLAASISVVRDLRDFLAMAASGCGYRETGRLQAAGPSGRLLRGEA